MTRIFSDKRARPFPHMRVRAPHIECIGSAAIRVKPILALLVVLLLPLAVVRPAFAEVRSADRVDGVSASQLGVPSQAMPDVAMKAGMLVTEDGRVLWARRPSDRRAMASLTKIMTAVVAMENSKPSDMVTVGRDSKLVGESTSFLREGERLPMSELLEALLVKSGNDAAVAIAEHVAGDQDKFVAMMNQKAAELGLSRTRFANPHGLDEADHYTTASDLAVLSRYAMSKPDFRDIVGEKYATIGSGARAERLTSTNLLLGNYRGANGIKTGWTGDAGYCVVDSAARDGVELYAIVLGTGGEIARFRDARELLDFGFAHYRPQSLASSGTVVGEAPVADYLDVTVPAAFSEDTTVAVFDLAGEITRGVTVSKVDAPVKAGQRVGVATFTQRGEVIASVPLVAVRDVPEPTPLQRIGIALVRAWNRLTGSA